MDASSDTGKLTLQVLIFNRFKLIKMIQDVLRKSQHIQFENEKMPLIPGSLRYYAKLVRKLWVGLTVSSRGFPATNWQCFQKGYSLFVIHYSLKTPTFAPPISSFSSAFGRVVNLNNWRIRIWETKYPPDGERSLTPKRKKWQKKSLAL